MNRAAENHNAVLPREPLYTLARLLARQAVDDYLTAQAQQKQRDSAERPNRGVSAAVQKS
ncbi:MAG TPA: hypothetical protein VFM97_11275 [Gammaproteobacteria bacterium]|nr:hypothetical protein [Gammaproteobacteria bacterium]